MILGIDFGLKKVGLAAAEGPIAEPLEVVRYSDKQKLFEKIEQIIKKRSVSKIVIGISEGEMATLARSFGSKIQTKTKLPVVFFDETLSTQDAIRASIQAGVGPKKRKSLEDAFAASVILQNYIDSHPDSKQ